MRRMTVRLAGLDAAALAALVDGDVAAASRAAGVELPEAFLEDEALWRLRLEEARERWLVAAIVADDIVVGHAGYHGHPGADARVEVGYFVLPGHRRRGHARAALQALLDEAAARGARTVRASVSPSNDPSLSLLRSFGFERVGEQWDDEDGYELVFERGVS